jgi:fatty-acyl-CoA synthase
MAGRSTYVYALERNAKRIGGTPALVQGNRYLTYRDLDRRANQVGHALLEHGVRRGERVAIALYNGFEFMEMTYGAWKCAAISIPLNYRFMDEELVHVLDNSDSVGVVVGADFAEVFERILPRLPKIRFMLIVGDEVHEDPAKGIFDYHREVGRMPISKPKLPWREQSDDDIGYNIYTGGTTGMPKGIAYKEKAFTKTVLEAASGSIPEILQRLSHAPDSLFNGLPAGGLLKSQTGRSLLRASWLGRTIKAGARIAPISYNPIIPRLAAGELRALFVSPLMHAWAWGISTALLRFGGTCFFLAKPSYDPEEALDIISNARIRLFAAIGDSSLRPILETLDQKQAQRHWHLDDLSVIIASGMPTSAEVKEGLLKHHFIKTVFLDVFISSEITHGAFTVYTSADTNFNKAVFKVTDRIKILDSETLEEVKPGEVGEVARRTDILPEGYYKDPEKTKKLIREKRGEKWLMSGDLALLDEQGYFHFVGRGSECINTGGEKVYPEEVENLLKHFPGVRMVGVTATPDEKYGELVTAVIEREPDADFGAEEVMEYCRGKIAGYKRPRRVIFVDEFPTTLVGKAHYRRLREIAKESLTQQQKMASSG